MKPLGISHVGIAVLDLERAVSDYCSIFEFDSVERVSMESEGVNIALLKTRGSEIELLSPTKDGSSLSKFLKDRGEGIHHVAIRVEDVTEAIARAKALGYKVLDEKPKKGAKGAHAAFVHPKSLHGVLLEFYDR
jgi:methylmalonyl-CoA/ethylmalonyl-CoA epimerase